MFGSTQEILPIHVEFLSDQRTIFKNCVFPTVNYEDPNFNISIPIFSIHGNHDDPSGFGRMSALDLLSVSGFVNYFGKWTDLNKVKVYPLMLQKGATKLAIYGLSHIKDDRLYRLMKHNEVEYITPFEDADSFFNLMVLHQNRVDRPGTNHIPENLLPSFIDLVFWGHEHDCRVKPEWNQEKQFYVTQPGSSVVTSLCEGEALEKHVAILKVQKQNFKLEPILLKTIRPFVFDTVKLSDWNMKLYGNNPSDIIQEYVDKYIRSKLLEKAKDLKTDDPNQPTLPLIRLRIEYEEEYECFNVVRFGQTFTGQVANPANMVIMKRKAAARTSRKGNRAADAPEPSIPDINISMTELIEQYFEGLPEKAHMKVLSRTWLAEGMSRFIDKDEKDALDDIIYHEMKKARGYLEKENVEPDNITECLNRFNEMRMDRTQELEEVQRLLESDTRGQRDSKAPTQTITHILSDDDDDFGPPVAKLNGSKSERGRGRGRGRGSRGGKAASSTRGAKSSASERSMLDSTASKSITSLSTARKSTRTTAKSKSITSYLSRAADSDEMSQDSEDFTQTTYKPSPKKKMKFMYVDDE
ncbi:double strand break repair nuclease mre11 isoform X2 [Rhodnius prolixus]|uniref:double strand break repair nuclease mre11 isoform X2 n=1 Tax=Rhodnius prolixus TaxID=13249 RepID=UPI003D18A1D7